MKRILYLIILKWCSYLTMPLPKWIRGKIYSAAIEKFTTGPAYRRATYMCPTLREAWDEVFGFYPDKLDDTLLPEWGREKFIQFVEKKDPHYTDDSLVVEALYRGSVWLPISKRGIALRIASLNTCSISLKSLRKCFYSSRDRMSVS